MIRAQIGGLEVKGFRRFQTRAEYRFRGPDEHPPETLIVAGPNGSGKSSFLEAILFALGRDQLLHRQLRDHHRRRWLQEALTTDVHIRVTLYIASAPGTMLGTRAPCTIEITRSLTGWTVSEVGESKPISDDQSVIRSLLEDLPIEWFSSWRQPYLGGPVLPMAELPATVSNEAGRLWRVKQRIVDERTRSAFRRNIDTEEEFRDQEWLQKLTNAWAALRGDDGTRFDVALDPNDPARRHFDLYLQKKFDPSYDLEYVDVCAIDQLSSGELEWLALAGTLITSGADGIVLIDEPELHFNPDWQSRILPALRGAAPDAQLILATHSDSPWDQAYSFERLLLVPSDDPRARRSDE